MTRSMAIKWLKWIQNMFPEDSEQYKALQLGIDSMKVDEAYQLEYESSTKNDLGVDAVSRQAVLDLIADYDLSMGQFVRGIHALPSVTPQEPQTFKWCETCKEYDQEKHCCHRWSKVIRDTVKEMKQEQEPILDEIRDKSIDEAIPILHDMYNYYNDADIDAYVGFDKEDNNAIEIALDTMRKYQKIKEIMDELNGNFYGSYLKDRQAIMKICEVLEDGNDRA